MEEKPNYLPQEVADIARTYMNFCGYINSAENTENIEGKKDWLDRARKISTFLPPNLIHPLNIRYFLQRVEEDLE